MVLVMSALSFLTRYPPASSGPWLPGVMACQGRNRRLVRDCPTSIDAQMTRKVQRVEGVTGVRMCPGQAPRVITGYFGSGVGAIRGCLVRRGVRMPLRNGWWGKHHESRYAGTVGCYAL